MTKNTTIAQRIATIIAHLQISTNEFANQLGYNRSQVLYDILKLKSKPSFCFFERLSQSIYGNVFSMEWLISGQGHFLKDNKNDTADHSSIEVLHLTEINETQKSLIEMQKKEIKRLETAISLIQSTK